MLVEPPFTENPMRKSLTLLLIVILAGNGLLMLAAPGYWYHLIPTVPFTGPFNEHFVRDIGCAYLACGLAFAWLLRNPARWPAAAIASLFLILHALTHVWDGLAGRESLAHLLSDIPAVFLIPLLAAGLSWPRD